MPAAHQSQNRGAKNKRETSDAPNAQAQTRRAPDQRDRSAGGTRRAGAADWLADGEAGGISAKGREKRTDSKQIFGNLECGDLSPLSTTSNAEPPMSAHRRLKVCVRRKRRR